MAEEKNGKPSSQGYFRKNFEKLKYYQHFYYMISRWAYFFAAVLICLGFYVWDAAYFHSPDGIPMKYIFVAAILTLLNGLRKMVIRLIQMKEQTITIHIDEEPHDPNEPRWWRIGFRFPAGLRRGLVGAIALAVEFLAVVLLALSWVALGMREQLFVLSWDFPFVMKPIALADWTLPENFWMGILIFSLFALVISWLNNAIFLMKYPQVRETVFNLLNDYLLGLHPAHVVAGRVVEHFNRHGEKDTECCPEVVAARLLALLPSDKPQDLEKQDAREARMRELIDEVIKLLKKNGNRA